MIHFILPGEVPSKKNNWHVGKNGQVYTAAAIKQWVKDSLWLLKPVLRKVKTVKKPCTVILVFYVKHDKDIDNMVGSVFDLLQTAKILENDKLVNSLIASKIKVTGHWRVEVGIKESDIL